MVLSLADLSLVAIRDAVEIGVIKDLSRLSPALRQSVLNMVLRHGTINKRPCISALSSMEFLNGFTSLDTQSGCVDDQKYLHRVAISIRTVLNDGTTIADGIRQLKLNLYWTWQNSMISDANGGTSNVDDAIELIGHCSRLKSLDICAMCMPRWIGEGMLLFPDSAAADNPKFRRIIQNIEYLSVTNTSDQGEFYFGNPLLEPGRLISLKLRGTRYRTSFMENAWGTLKSIHRQCGRAWYFDANSILPVPLPHLKSVKAKVVDIFTVNERFMNTVLRCPSLEHIFLDVIINNWTRVDWAALDQLRQFNGRLSLKTSLQLTDNADYIENTFKFIDLFGDAIVNLEIQLVRHNDATILALQRLVDACHGLVKFKISHASEEFRSISNAVASLFVAESRAFKLRKLKLRGDFDPCILQAIFENCVNLERLRILMCPQLDNSHLIKWASQGGRLSRLALEYCNNVNGDGLIPICLNSGRKLKKFEALGMPMNDHVWRVLIENCRYVNMISGDISEDMASLLRSKCFNANVQVKAVKFS